MTDWVVGFTPNWKSGEAEIESVIAFVRVMLPELLVTVSGNVPVSTVGWVVTVRTVLAVGVMGLLANWADAPVGNPDTPSVTAELNPFTDVSCVV